MNQDQKIDTKPNLKNADPGNRLDAHSILTKDSELARLRDRISKNHPRAQLFERLKSASASAAFFPEIFGTKRIGTTGILYSDVNMTWMVKHGILERVNPSRKPGQWKFTATGLRLFRQIREEEQAKRERKLSTKKDQSLLAGDDYLL